MLSFIFETSKEGTGRAYPPTCNPPSKTNYIPSTQKNSYGICYHMDLRRRCESPTLLQWGPYTYTYHCVTLERQPSMFSMGLLTKKPTLHGPRNHTSGCKLGTCVWGDFWAWSVKTLVLPSAIGYTLTCFGRFFINSRNIPQIPPQRWVILLKFRTSSD